jgi:hypothetical protein
MLKEIAVIILGAVVTVLTLGVFFVYWFTTRLIEGWRVAGSISEDPWGEE